MAEVTEGTLPVGNTGEKLDTTVITQDDGTEAHREAIFIADPADFAARAVVALQALSTNYALTTADPKTEDVVLALESVITELKMVNAHLNQITGLES